eukprot:9478785-Karenia_brevis.AAC.1
MSLRAVIENHVFYRVFGSPRSCRAQILEPWRAPDPNVRTLACSTPKFSHPGALQAQILKP